MVVFRGAVGRFFFKTKVDSWFDWIQAHGPFAQNWFNCDPTAPDIENVNLEWAVRHCDGISHETGVNGWGNSYDIKPNQKTAPLDLDVNYAMRCEYPDYVAVQCLCPEKTPPEGGAQICSKRMRKYRGLLQPRGWKEWGKYNYSSPEYCWKLNVIIDRLLGTICSEHAHCAGGLQCSDGVCSTCPNFECPDRQSDKLSAWNNTCKYAEYGCPNSDCAQEGEGCSSTNLGLGCCEGLSCSSDGRCIRQGCLKTGSSCTVGTSYSCQGNFCLPGRVWRENRVVSGQGRECYIEGNGVSPNYSISELFCDVELNTCYRSYDKPIPIYKPRNSECKEHFDCDEGLYCNGGICSACQVAEGCPEKRNPNFPVCKYGEYECPDRCLVGNDECNRDNDECCLGLRCEYKQIGFSYRNVYVLDECKKTGDCRDDSKCCDSYGCLNGTVVYAVGQKCYLENGQASINFTGGTICDTDTNKCYISNQAPKIIYNDANYIMCKYDFDCNIGLHCDLDPNSADGKGRCSVCQAGEECPEKGNPNFNTCKRGEYGCPDPCVAQGNECNDASASCCRGSKCDGKKCVACKMYGEYSSDDKCCDGYGCHNNGKVIYAKGQKCNSDSDCLRDTKCHNSVKVCH